MARARSQQTDGRNPELDLGFEGSDFPEVRLNPEEFNGIVEGRGVGCLFRRAVLCPCRRRETGQARAGCPSCSGMGYAYPEDLEEPIVALVLNRSPRRSRGAGGETVIGTVQITFPSGIIPGQGDMVIPDSEEHLVQQVLYRSVREVDPQVVRDRATTPTQRAPAIEPVTERLLYPDVIALDDVRWIDETGRLRLAKEGRDFTRERNVLTWREGSGPPAGRGFSVRYRAPAAYVISPAEPVARTGEEGFPYRVEGQRLDKWGTPDLR